MPRKSLIGRLGYETDTLDQTDSFSAQGAGKYSERFPKEKFPPGELLGELVYNPETGGLKLVPNHETITKLLKKPPLL